MKKSAALQPGHYYHLYNRGNNREDLFREERNYRYFLELYAHHIGPVADTLAYCLLKNHFHLLVKMKAAQTSQVFKTCEVSVPKTSQSFSNLFNAYTKAINKAYGRTGSLFQERFQRIEVTTDRYFLHLVFYIHFNPAKTWSGLGFPRLALVVLPRPGRPAAHAAQPRRGAGLVRRFSSLCGLSSGAGG